MDENFDFVIIGSGGGALCAALLMRSLGKTVLVLEKAEFAGGTTARSGGVMWIPNNRFMKADGLGDSADKAAAYMDSVVGDHDDTPGATRERRLTYIAESNNMLEFLIGQGLKFRRIPCWPDYYDSAPGAAAMGRAVIADLFDTKQLGTWKDKLAPGLLPLPAYLYEAMELPNMGRSWSARKTLAKVILRTIGSKLMGKNLVTAGAALQGQALHAALKAGADIRVSSPVTRLVIENGRATGVVTQKDGKEWRVGAHLGVLINAGGFSHHQPMRDRYAPGTSTEWSAAGPGDTGEIIAEAMRIGAATAQMEARVCMPAALPPDKTGKPVWAGVQNDLAKPHSLLVDQSGERYMSEAGCYMDLCRGMAERHKTVPAVPSWMVLDSQYLARYMLAGSFPGSKKPPLWTDSGFLRQAPSLAELAQNCGIDAGKLAATVERFNGFARAGRDGDFGRGVGIYHDWLGDPEQKPSASLGTVEQGPFYAIQVFPGDVGTFGGIVTDMAARVLRDDGSVIDGLYATGTSTASVMGRASTGAGSSIGPSLTWGYVAAKHAARA
jgi:3-oxosteroid 1-dehydrogenase